MRILFICSSLEPGRDGVGDHAMRMAQACREAGHDCGLVGLHDRFVDPSVGQEESQGEMPRLRLSPEMGWEKRAAAASAFRADFRPDWVSVHFVPYGFSQRGFAFALIPALRKIVGDCPVHLMFHELWIGAAQGVPFKERITGLIQRVAIRKLLRELKPLVVTTTIPDYVKMLAGLGAQASLLPLFGNIPIINPATTPFKLKPFFDAAGVPIESPVRQAWWIGLFFGALHAEWKPEPLFSILLRAAERAGKKLCLVQVGRMGGQGDKVWNRVTGDYSDRIMMVKLEEQSPEQVSLIAQRADFGVAASPWQLIGKSSSVASLLDHGLPVIVSRDDYHLRGSSSLPASGEPLLYRGDDRLEEKLVAGLPKGTPQPRLPGIAVRFCALLEQASPGKNSGSAARLLFKAA